MLILFIFIIAIFLIYLSALMINFFDQNFDLFFMKKRKGRKILEILKIEKNKEKNKEK